MLFYILWEKVSSVNAVTDFCIYLFIIYKKLHFFCLIKV